MPAQRKDQKAPRQKRNKQSSPEYIPGDDTSQSVRQFTEDQLKLRAMIPALTPAHGLESTSTAILGSLSLGQQKPNSHTRKKSDGHVNRPPNAFIVFRRAQVQHMPANVTQHQQRISNLTAMFWRVLTSFEQKTWYNLADDIKSLHTILFPEYNFSPRNADAPKKPAVPHAGLTPERFDFAWNEAQILIKKHSTMIDYTIDGPAPSGKLVRPKAPRKGQGTRAKERRQLEAAQRANAEVPLSDPTMFASNGFQDSCFDDPQFFGVEEEPITNSSGESEGVQWSAEFSLDGSVSSRSSPAWSEPVGPLEQTYNEGPFEPAAYVHEHQVAPDAAVPTSFDGVDNFSLSGHHQDNIMFNHNIVYETSHNYLDPVMATTQFMVAPAAFPKHDVSFEMTGHYNASTPVQDHLQQQFYMEVPTMHANTSSPFDFSSIDPVATYLHPPYAMPESGYTSWTA